MNPIALSIAGFLSYRDPVEIDFSNIEVACIAGANGAGKSSILDAITWALFGKARKTDDTLINNQSEIADVSLIYEYETNIYRIHRLNPRDKTKNLEFQILVSPPETASQSDRAEWKTLTEHTMRDTQEAIENTLRLDYETFINAAFFLQGNADNFTTQRPGKRKEILSNILGLEIWEKYRRDTFQRRRNLENQVHQISGRLESIQGELNEEEERRKRLAALEIQLESLIQTRKAKEELLRSAEKVQEDLRQHRRTVDLLQSAFDEAQADLDKIEDRLKNRQEQANKHKDVINRAEEIEKAYQEWQKLKQQLSELEQQERKVFRLKERRSKPQLEIEREKARLEGLRNQYQQQKIALDEQLASLPKLQGDLSAVEKRLIELHNKIEEREKLRITRQERIDQLSKVKAEAPVLKEEMNEIKHNLKTLEEPGTTLCPLCEQPLEDHDLVQLIDKLQTEGKEKGDRYRLNLELIEQYNLQIQELDRSIAEFSNLDQNVIGLNRQADQLRIRLEEIETNQKGWEDTTEPEFARINEALEKQNFATEARKVLAQIDEEINSIGYDQKKHDDLKVKVSEVQNAEEDHKQLAVARSALDPLNDEIADLKTRLEERESSVASQKDKLDEQIAVLAVKEAESPSVKEAQDEVLKLQLEENKLRAEVGGARQKVEVLKTLKQRKADAKEEKEALNQQISHYKQLERAFSKDGVPALLIEQALPQIEEKANQILEKLTSGSMNVRFVTQRDYKDKSREDRKETLDIQISDRAGIRDYELYSGGEAFRINFSIRLALSEVLAKRAGARLKLLVIDEGFGSQDAVGRQRLVEAIQMVKDDYEKILVITHIDELKDSFPTRIEVTKSERGSTVQIT